MEIPCAALLFDFDGVLADSDASVESAWTRWAQRYGLEPAAVLAVVHGRRSADTVAALIGPDRRAQALADVDRYEVEDAGSVTPLPGAAQLLGALPAGSWAIVTSGRRELTTARLAAAGLPQPAVLVCAEDVPAGKPDPAGYRQAAVALGVPAGRCVVLEDSPSGVAAGLAAGAAVVGVGERALGTPALVVVPDLAGARWADGVLHLSAMLRG